MADVDFNKLKDRIRGGLKVDDLHKIIYATDASVYREMPLGVVYPMDENDIQEIVKFCNTHRVPMIPRAGGTSLAGQTVGKGLVVDVSKHMNEIIKINQEERLVTVQPGIIRDGLNNELKPFGLLFGPNTATANRATIGGMVGNNSCGTTSIVFGNTRDHIKEIKAVLSDGSLTKFGELSRAEFIEKCTLEGIEGSIYRELQAIINDEKLRSEIASKFPAKSISRRNTGYAIDTLIDIENIRNDLDKINVCQLLCGSEGTLAFTTEITIGLVDMPEEYEALVAIHYNSIDESLRSVPVIMDHRPYACELMDKTILDCTKGQITYEKDRYFLEGDPKGVMLVSFRGKSKKEATQKVHDLIDSLKKAKFGYTYPVILDGIDRVWNLRSAGLGLLANLPGDKKAVACIEDTAVDIKVLADYIEEFTELMEGFGQASVYYAHAGAGELHLRPILDLKTKEDKSLFFEISLASARLVKKYGGSLSGEHGDGRVRAPFIEEFYGQIINTVFKKIKSTFDPLNIFNPGKIVDPAPMNDDLRFDYDHEERSYDTMFDFSSTGGILRAAEKCNGSGDCRKLPVSGGTMCPSYMATRDEKDTTRARANTLREILTRPKKDNAWNNEELKSVMDLCLSCKGCSSECPSNVDMTAMKAEFTYQYNKVNGVPRRSKLFANFSKLNGYASKAAGLANFATQSSLVLRPLIKKVMGVHPSRSLPKVESKTLRKRWKSIKTQSSLNDSNKHIYLFCDEFTNYTDATLGENCIRLLNKLGYAVSMIDHEESGRTALSKGLLDKAKSCANRNVEIFSEVLDESSVLVGIEPSAILSFRDEYPRLVDDGLKARSKEIAKSAFTIEEFLYQEVVSGNIKSSHFTTKPLYIHLHGHCHQKALTDIKEVAWLLSLPKNYEVQIIPSGCCGMAGSFGYEKEHYEVSMQIGELVLFPAVRSIGDTDIVAASGTSCRHQILDGTKVKALHPVDVLYEALV